MSLPIAIIAGLLGVVVIAIVLVISLKKKKEEATNIVTDQNQSSVHAIAKPTGEVSKPGAKDTVSYVRPPSKTQSSGPRKYKKICLVCAREFPDDYSGKCPEDGLELSRITDYLAPGSKFSEYYEIVSPLGSGGLSNVFLAKHISSRKEVAIKLLHSHLANDDTAVQRFQREAKALSTLSHENLVAVEDFMVSANGVPFIVMEFLEGESLEQLLKRVGRLSWRDTANFFVQICKGLSHAHSKGIIHRDLKPANIMLVPDKGNVVAKVVDFGLVKVNDPDNIARLTSTGEVFGSPMYMSPEQCQGQAVDRRTDVYSCACIIYECLTGEPPFLGKNVIETLSMHLNAEPAPIPPDLNIPPWMVNIVQQAMRKDPNKRLQSIEDLGASIQDGLRASSRN